MATDRTAKQAYFRSLLEDSSFTKSDPMSDRQRLQIEETWKAMTTIYPPEYDAHIEPKKRSQSAEKVLLAKYQIIPSAAAFDAVRLSKWADNWVADSEPTELEEARQNGMSVDAPRQPRKDYSWAPIENLRGRKNLGIMWKKALEVFVITVYSEDADDLVLQIFHDQLEQHGWLIVKARIA